ncbi:glycosyltransferase [Pseudohongiella sp.]|uniref:Glycosyltransferase 2-like domain-containing protein n=1 Tax=marine sediment metagenome TaxID=412755 RepID=A0A0F9YIH4_9ZZZZ|nr:glycosyltransferase [Pseudohongiella sp.]HDZ07780.1 glycosyltransferase [Pseudohongiella sp.]HEA62903.1 glycosyltransferase [Pseudohongiella sp.]
MTAIKRTDATPLVSIICRTMSRNSLHDTLRSVLNQDWPALELVLVDAANVGANALADTAIKISQTSHVSLNIVSTGSTLARPQAANAGLSAATGSYLLFLDDDDWIAADHISHLVTLAQKHNDHQVIYSATQKTDTDGSLLDEIIAVPFDRTVLRRDNFIPIHAALFSAALRDTGCRFDETLDVYEDWDFWLQCAEQTDFLLDDHIGAFYRMGGDSETMLTEHQARYQPDHPMAQARAKLLDKWKSRWTGAQWNAVLGLVDQTPLVHSLHTDLGLAHQQLHEQQQTLTLTQQQLTEQQLQLTGLRSSHEELKASHQEVLEEYRHLQAAHIELNLAHQALDQGVREILSSFSWRVTAPYRWTRRRLTDALSGALHRHRRQQTRTSPPETTADNPLLCGIVSPASDNLAFSTTLTMQAWAWSPAPLQTIEILIDGRLHDRVEPLPQHQHPEDAQRIGFARAIDTSDLSPGEHVIALICTDSDGHRAECQRRFVSQQAQTLYSRWRQQQITLPTITTQPKTDFHVLLRAPSDISADPQASDALLATLDSLGEQNLATLPQVHWRCSVISDAADHTALQNLLANHHTRKRVRLLTDQAGFTPDPDSVVSLLQAGDALHPDCLANVAAAWQASTQLLYTDHDHRDAAGRFRNPWFTFAWSPALLLSQNYIGGVYFVRADLVPAISLNTPAWRYDCLLRLQGQLDPARVTRIPRVLWSEPGHDENSNVIAQAELDVLRAHMSLHDNQVNVPWPQAIDIRHTVHPMPTPAPRVSIVIPTTGNMRFLKPCLDTLATTDYPDMEIIILDNSRGKHPKGIDYARQAGAVVVDCDEAFNWSRLNNKGVDHSSGDILLFLNDDIEIVQNDWLQELVRQVLQEGVATVGCLLLYPNGAIQHGGVFLVDHGGGARHLFHKQLPGAGIYQRLDKSVREVSASTGACLMIRRDRFEQLGRFDEELSIVGNDIDLCLRGLEAGLRNIWTPHSVLIHHESVSRQSKPIGKDEKTMWRRWGHRFRMGDPYYNPSLSLLREDCALATQTPPAGVHATTTTRSSGEHGVNLIAYIRASMGVGEAARGNAAALQASGRPFGIINYERGNPSRMDNLRWQHKEIAKPQFNINLLHINADHIPVVMKDLGRAWFKDRYNIGFWAWEMPEFPDQWLASFDLLDEIWVPSTYVNQAVAAKSPVPVITIPHVIDMDMDAAQRYPREHFGIDPQAFVFISMFDTHSIAQRKNPFGSIRAFQQAFAADDRAVQLVIKVNNADAASTAVLRDCIGDYQNILVLDQHFDRSQIDSLINCIDCYVSLHHAEGFGLGPAEAMALGKVALLTDWSGNTEYMTTDNCVPIRYTLKTLGKDYGPYEAHQHWAVADIEHAAQEMRDLAGNPTRVAALGERASTTIAETLSAQAIGERMRMRLQSIERIASTRSKRNQV